MEFGLASYGFGLLAGVLSTLSPCVLPIIPILLGSAATARGRATALTAFRITRDERVAVPELVGLALDPMLVPRSAWRAVGQTLADRGRLLAGLPQRPVGAPVAMMRMTPSEEGGHRAPPDHPGQPSPDTGPARPPRGRCR